MAHTTFYLVSFFKDSLRSPTITCVEAYSNSNYVGDQSDLNSSLVSTPTLRGIFCFCKFTRNVWSLSSGKERVLGYGPYLLLDVTSMFGYFMILAFQWLGLCRCFAIIKRPSSSPTISPSMSGPSILRSISMLFTTRFLGVSSLLLKLPHQVKFQILLLRG